jgi:hypothetical protein
VSNELRVSSAPEFKSTIRGIRGVVLDPPEGNNQVLGVATSQECSHRCHVNSDCIIYTWLGKGTSSVIGTLKSILSIADDEDGGKCYNFNEKDSEKISTVAYHSHGMSGAKDPQAKEFSNRIRDLLKPTDVDDKNDFSSSAIKISFGGGSVEGWNIDAGKISSFAKSPATDKSPVGTYGWNCDMSKDVRQRPIKDPHKNTSDLTNNLIILSRHDKCASPRWAIKVNPGIYKVVIGYVDTQEVVVAEHCKLNGEPANDGSVISGSNFQYESFQDLKDGRLVFEGKYTKRCTSITFVVIDEATHYFA